MNNVCGGISAGSFFFFFYNLKIALREKEMSETLEGFAEN